MPSSCSLVRPRRLAEGMRMTGRTQPRTAGLSAVVVMSRRTGRRSPMREAMEVAVARSDDSAGLLQARRRETWRQPHTRRMEKSKTPKDQAGKAHGWILSIQAIAAGVDRTIAPAISMFV